MNMRTKKRNTEFGVVEAIQIQNRHLAGWKSKLKPEVYLALDLKAKESNIKAKIAYDVFRGDDMTTFILNYKIKK